MRLCQVGAYFLVSAFPDGDHSEVLPKKDFAPTLVEQLNGPFVFSLYFSDTDYHTAQFGHLDAGAVLRMKKMLRDHHPDSTSQNMKEILGVIAAFEVSSSSPSFGKMLSRSSPVCHKRNSKLWQQSCKSSLLSQCLILQYTIHVD